MKKTLILILTIATLISCSNNDDKGNVNIRLSNSSNFNFENIIVNTSTGNMNYDNLNSGEFSEYKTYELAYRYAFIELLADGETYTLQPIDYVGETPLKNGNYTYEINVNPQSQFEKITISLLSE